MDLEKRKLAAVCALLIGYGAKLKKSKTKRTRQRRMWVKPWIMERERLGAYNTLLNNANLFTLSDREDYRRFMRMNTETFNEVLEKIRPYITKQETFMRKPISAHPRTPTHTHASYEYPRNLVHSLHNNDIIININTSHQNSSTFVHYCEHRNININKPT